MLKTSCVGIFWYPCLLILISPGLLRICSRLIEHRLRRENRGRPWMPPRVLLSLQIQTPLLLRPYSLRQQSYFTFMVRVSSNAPSFQQDKHYLIYVCYRRNGCAYTPVSFSNNYYTVVLMCSTEDVLPPRSKRFVPCGPPHQAPDAFTG
jgi:hypothetical protein